MYDEPIHPKNLFLGEPLNHARADDVYRANIGRLIERGTFTPPAHSFPGAEYIPMDDTPAAEAWEQAKALWEGWGEE